MEFFLIATLVLSSYVTLSSGQAFNPKSQPWKFWRTIPTDIRPTRYDLHITPYFYDNQSHFDGHAIIHMSAAHSVSNIIVVHSKRLELLGWRVLDGSYKEIRGTRYIPYKKRDYLVFRGVNSFPPEVKLRLSFRGNITNIGDQSEDSSAIYKIPYINKLNGKLRWLLVTNFRPGNTRTVFPTFDDPTFKARFNITIRHRQSYIALSNTPVESQINVTRSMDETAFKLSPRMNSHLVRFTISEFGFKNTTINGTEYRVWARPDRLNELDHALNVTAAVQEYLFQELGMPNSLEKLDQFSIPGDLEIVNGEQWGLATYQESKLLSNAPQEEDDTKDGARALITQTLVDSYFELLSSSLTRYRNQVWLKEGLTKFYEIEALKSTYPTRFHRTLYERMELALNDERTGNAHALVPPSTGDRRQEKGAAILRMVESFVGVNAFRRSVVRFLRGTTNRAIVALDLWHELQQEVGGSLDVKRIMSTWVHESGIPVVQVELLPENVINATQKQFAARNSMKKWHIPLSYRTKSGDNGIVWMNKTDVRFDAPLNSSSDWIEFNCERSGYYRVNYDNNLRNRIANQLNENHTVFTELTRSTLLSDVVQMFFDWQLGLDAFLNLTKYASEEMDLNPWQHILDMLEWIRFGLFHTTIASHFESYALNLTTKLVDEFRLQDENSFIKNSHGDQLRWKIISFSCTAGHKGCIENRTRAFKAWIENETHVVPENSRREVCCTAMAHSVDESDWNTTFQRYIMAQSVDERNDLFNCLCCSRNRTILNWFLDFFLAEFEPDYSIMMDIMNAFKSIGRNPSAANLIWKWFKNNYVEINRISEGLALQLIGVAVPHFGTQAQYQEVLDFYATHRPNVAPDDLERLANRMIESNIQWMDRNFNTIANWLQQNTNES